MSELSSASPTPPRNQRPSLMASSDADAGGDAFGVSILSAARTEPKVAGTARAAPASAQRPGRWVWWVGIVVVAAGMWGAAHWRKQTTETDTPVVALRPAPAVQASVDTKRAPVAVAAPSPLAAASQPAPPGAAALPTAAPSAAAAPPAVLQHILAQAQPEVPPAGAVLRELAGERSAAKPKPAVAAAKPTKAPAAAAASAVPPPAKVRDRDAELVAAVMAHAEGDSPKSGTANTKPLSAAERDRFAATLRQCKEQFGNDIARDACRAQACDANQYWGRTKSCPLQADAPAPRARKS